MSSTWASHGHHILWISKSDYNHIICVSIQEDLARSALEKAKDVGGTVRVISKPSFAKKNRVGNQRPVHLDAARHGESSRESQPPVTSPVQRRNVITVRGNDMSGMADNSNVASKYGL